MLPSMEKALGLARVSMRLRPDLERVGPLRRRHALCLLGLCVAAAASWSSLGPAAQRPTKDTQVPDEFMRAWIRPAPKIEPRTLAGKAMDLAIEHLAKAASLAGRALRALHGQRRRLLGPSDPVIVQAEIREIEQPSEEIASDTGRLSRTILMLAIGAAFGALVALAMLMAKRRTKASAAVGPVFAACRGPCEDLKPKLEEGSNPLHIQESKIRIIAGSTVVEVPRPPVPTDRALPGPLARDGGLSAARSPSARLPSAPARLSKVPSPINSPASKLRCF